MTHTSLKLCNGFVFEIRCLGLIYWSNGQSFKKKKKNLNQIDGRCKSQTFSVPFLTLQDDPRLVVLSQQTSSSHTSALCMFYPLCSLKQKLLSRIWPALLKEPCGGTHISSFPASGNVVVVYLQLFMEKQESSSYAAVFWVMFGI